MADQAPAKPTRVRIETSARLVEVEEYGRTAEQLAKVAEQLWTRTDPGPRSPMGFTPAGGNTGSVERRASDYADRKARPRGPARHHRIADPVAEHQE